MSTVTKLIAEGVDFFCRTDSIGVESDMREAAAHLGDELRSQGRHRALQDLTCEEMVELARTFGNADYRFSRH